MYHYDVTEFGSIRQVESEYSAAIAIALSRYRLLNVSQQNRVGHDLTNSYRSLKNP